MQQYIYESMWSQELEDAIDASPSKPIVLEMFHKYGFKVYSWQKKLTMYNADKGGYDTVQDKDTFLLTLDGTPICGVSAKHYDGKLEYSVYSNLITKERASNDIDRRTLRSVKLSSLMKTLDKRKVFEEDVDMITNGLKGLIYTASRNLEVEHQSKRMPLGAEATNKIHKILEAVVANKTSELAIDLKEYSKQILDTFNKVDNNNKTRLTQLNHTFNDCFVIYCDTSDGYVVARANAVVKDSRNNSSNIEDGDVSLEFTSPAMRVKELESHPDYKVFGGVLTMFKVLMDEKIADERYGYRYKNRAQGLIPETDEYFKELDVAVYYRGAASSYEGAYLCIPVN